MRRTTLDYVTRAGGKMFFTAGEDLVAVLYYDLDLGAYVIDDTFMACVGMPAPLLDRLDERPVFRSLEAAQYFLLTYWLEFQRRCDLVHLDETGACSVCARPPGHDHTMLEHPHVWGRGMMRARRNGELVA